MVNYTYHDLSFKENCFLIDRQRIEISGMEGDQEAEAPGFNWRDHVSDLQKRGANSSFKCGYCSAPMCGGRTRLIEHFVGVRNTKASRASVRRCATCPSDVISAAMSAVAQESIHDT